MLGDEYDDEMFGYNNGARKEKKKRIKDAEQVHEEEQEKGEIESGDYNYLSAEALKHANTLRDEIGGFTLNRFKRIATKVLETVIKANEEQKKDEIKQFINSNPGLESRFNRYIHFDDYTDEELMDIFAYNLRNAQYLITKDAYEAVFKIIKEKVANKDSRFGNARYVRNLFEKIIQKQSDRLAQLGGRATREQLSIITIDDVNV